MGVVITPLGFRKPDEDEPIRQGDNEIAHNAQIAQDLLAQVLGRLANLDHDGDPVQLQDAVVAGLLAIPTSQSSLSVGQRVAESMGGYALKPRNGRRAVGQGELVISAADYGLVGDGVANDTGALQYAINAAPAGGWVMIPDHAVCRITEPITLNKAILLTGGTVKTPSGVTALQINTSDVTIERVTIIGPGTVGGYNSLSFGIRTTGSVTSPLRNIQIRDVTVTGVDGEAVRLLWTNESSVTNPTILDTSYAGIMILSCKDVQVLGGLVDGLVQKAPAVNSYGIAVTDLDNTVAARSKNILIMGVTVKNVPGWEGIDTHGGDQVSVIGNTVYGCGAGIAFVVGNATRVTAPERGIIAHNMIERGPATAAFAGIRLIGKAGALASGSLVGNRVSGYASAYEISNVDESLCVFSGNMPALGDTVESAVFRQSGQVATGGATISVPITYTKSFRTAPRVEVNAMNGRITTRVVNRTTTGCTIELTNWTPATTSNFDVEWWAIE